MVKFGSCFKCVVSVNHNIVVVHQVFGMSEYRALEEIFGKSVHHNLHANL